MTGYRLATGVATALLVAIAIAAGPRASIAGPTTTSPDWPCVITFNNSLTYADVLGSHTIPTAIQSDGLGPYVHGKEGVQCYVNQGAGSSHFGFLYMNISKSSPRHLLFPGQTAVTAYTRSGYSTFQGRQPGYFEITRIDTANTVGTTYRRRVRIGVQNARELESGEFWGDNLATGSLTAGSSSAWVTPLDLCSWSLAWYPWAELEENENVYVRPRVLALREGPSRARIRSADVAMPFSATVTVTGVKSGCGTAP